VFVCPVSTVFQDNGIKLVDQLGDMLAESWEAHATLLANVHADGLVDAIHSIVAAEGISFDKTPSVLAARDTR
jgi:phosphoacetylglucosamine mutase